MVTLQKCFEHHNETLSTGVLRRHSATLFLTVEAMNVDQMILVE